MNVDLYLCKTVRLLADHRAMSGAIFPKDTLMLVETVSSHHLHLVALHPCPSCGAAPQRLRAIRMNEVEIVEQEMVEP